jgi:hypothetical protein
LTEVVAPPEAKVPDRGHNIGSTPTQVLFVELKQPPASPAGDEAAVEVGPQR